MQNKKSYYTVQEIFEYVNTIDSNIKTNKMNYNQFENSNLNAKKYIY